MSDELGRNGRLQSSQGRRGWLQYEECKSLKRTITIADAGRRGIILEPEKVGSGGHLQLTRGRSNG